MLHNADFAQISHGKYLPDHQFILKPVTGEGRVSHVNAPVCRVLWLTVRPRSK